MGNAGVVGHSQLSVQLRAVPRLQLAACQISQSSSLLIAIRLILAAAVVLWTMASGMPRELACALSPAIRTLPKMDLQGFQLHCWFVKGLRDWVSRRVGVHQCLGVSH